MATALSSTFPHTLTIDGQSIRVRVPRFDVERLEDFRDHYHSYITEGLAPQAEGESDAAYTRRARAWAREQMAWLRAVSAQVRIESGELTIDDQEVTDLLTAFPGRDDVIGMMLVAILLENTLTEAQKKVLRSRRDSPSGSATLIAASPETPGERPAPPAPSAENGSSARPDSAATSLDGGSSGATDPSRSASARSAA